MRRHVAGVLTVIDDAANLLPLAPTIHKIFENRDFVIVPKVTEARAEAGAGDYLSPQFATHILSISAAEFWLAYHRVLAQYLNKMSSPFLLACFV